MSWRDVLPSVKTRGLQFGPLPDGVPFKNGISAQDNPQKQQKLAA